ncbi:hypothetical protein [Salinarimonas ramus]|uniref:Uncharacterized protein n=1 Tax=Salinarimonas ramus TaxID=690164 RepID=A0A917Q648_9HYPH|nr:hypothetical protein [Salinarimonas ramus]GGK28212.1 hypothetical protein GCM10011322_13400 [Salinarimonas ramus]
MSAHSRHGGARSNAGRKPVLEPLQRVLVGAWCQQIQDAASAAAADSRMRNEVLQRWKSAEPSLSDIDIWAYFIEHWANIQRLAKEGKLPEGFTRTQEFEDDQLEHEVAEFRNRRKLLGSVQKRVLKRPKGIRNSIIAEISRRASEEFGVLVTRRLVDECWKEYRKHFPT